MNYKLLSNEYTVKKLGKSDIDDIYNLFLGNPLYYEYCPPKPTRDNIISEMFNLPPNTTISDKYYIGFYHNKNLIAVMDLIDGYPSKDIAFIGFFMTSSSIQKKGVGSKIISDTCKYLKEVNFSAVRLAWLKGNPQAEHFWTKNQFVGIKETSSTAADVVILAERKL